MKKQSGILGTIAFVIVIFSGALTIVVNYYALKDRQKTL